VTAKSDRKRARSLAASGCRAQPFLLSTRHRKSSLVNPGAGGVTTEAFRTASVAAAYVTLARSSPRSPRAEQIVNLTLSRNQRLSQIVGARRRLFARPAWPRRKLLLHDHQRASRKPAPPFPLSPRHHVSPRAEKIVSPTHKRTEGRAPMRGSDFTIKVATQQGGSREFTPTLNVKLWDPATAWWWWWWWWWRATPL
jgi:hypothetical protein